MQATGEEEGGEITDGLGGARTCEVGPAHAQATFDGQVNQPAEPINGVALPKQTSSNRYRCRAAVLLLAFENDTLSSDACQEANRAGGCS